MPLQLEDFEAWKESRESETGELQADVDVLTNDLQELEDELSSARSTVAMFKAAMDAKPDEEKRSILAEAMKNASSEVAEVESRHNALSQELSDKQANLYSRLGEDLSEARTKELVNELNASESETIRELALIDQRTNATVSHRDVGIGISQVLPVLVMAYGSRGKILAMEQPEIHLHPALQAELGDVFIESALGARKNTFILETHSEHLLLRIMRRLRESSDGNLPAGIPKLTADDVQVLYIEPLQEGSVAREMPLNNHGELVKAWPGGFFEEGLKEVMH